MNLVIFPIYFSFDSLIAELNITEFVAESNACNINWRLRPRYNAGKKHFKISDVNIIYVNGGK